MRLSWEKYLRYPRTLLEKHLRGFRPEKYYSYLLGIAASLALFSIILLAFRYNPITSMVGLVTGSFGSIFLASETFVLMAPFLLAALAFLVAYRARFYNIGVEGQLYIGALFAYLVGSQARRVTRSRRNSSGAHCLGGRRNSLAWPTAPNENQAPGK